MFASTGLPKMMLFRNQQRNQQREYQCTQQPRRLERDLGNDVARFLEIAARLNRRFGLRARDCAEDCVFHWISLGCNDRSRIQAMLLGIAACIFSALNVNVGLQMRSLWYRRWKRMREQPKILRRVEFQCCSPYKKDRRCKNVAQTDKGGTRTNIFSSSVFTTLTSCSSDRCKVRIGYMVVHFIPPCSPWWVESPSHLYELNMRQIAR